MGKELKIINILLCLLVMLISFGFNDGYWRPKHFQEVTTQASSGRGFGVCAACKARCDCPCIRQSCVDTSCCGEAGAVGPTNGIPPPSDTFGGGNGVTVDIRYTDNILIPKLFYIFHDYWY